MTDKKRQLIFFWTYLQWGGAQIYFIAIMKQAKPDWDVLVVLPRESSPEIIGFLDRIDVRYEFIDIVLDLDAAPTIGRKLDRQIRRVQAELASFRYLASFDLSECILHIETSPWQSWLFLTALSVRGANVFVTLHNALAKAPLWREMIWKARMQFVSRLPGFHIFTSNKDTKDRFRGWVSDRFWEKVRVTYTCVDPREIAQVIESSPGRPAIREQNGIDAGRFVVLAVGQFIDRKGRWIFLEAARAVIAEHPDALFVWLTPKRPNADETAKIAEYALGESFRLVLSETIGPKREDILRFFCIADVFALPSYVEGLPIALLEAMALGITAVSTNVYAIPEAVYPDQTGLLVEPGDAAALAWAIIELKVNEGLRLRLARDGQEFVLQNFDERVASQIAIDAYRECFANGR